MYIVKLPDKACVSHMKLVGENKTVLQLKQFAEVLLTGLTFKKILKKLKKIGDSELLYCFGLSNKLLVLTHSFLKRLIT